MDKKRFDFLRQAHSESTGPVSDLVNELLNAIQELNQDIDETNEEMERKINDVDMLQSNILKLYDDIEFWKRENSQSRAQYNGALQEVRRLQTTLDASNEQWKLFEQKRHEAVELVTECYGLKKENERLTEEVRDLQAKIEQLQELWNTAYDLGVRVEIDSVTGYVSKRWMEPKKRK